MDFSTAPLLLFEGGLFAAAAGLVYGVFGGGSGLFLMPGFYLLLRHFPAAHAHSMQVAIATTAAVSALLGIAPSWVQLKEQHVDLQVLRRCSLGILCGTIAAVLLLNVLPSGLLKQMFGVVVLLVAIWLWCYRQERDTTQWGMYGIKHYVATFSIGLLWFLLGIAVFTVPYLQKCGVTIRRSVGTATIISALFSAIAALCLMLTGMWHVGVSSSHLGFINLPLCAIAIVPSSLAAFFGAKVSVKLPQKHLKKVYALLIFVIGLLMLA